MVEITFSGQAMSLVLHSESFFAYSADTNDARAHVFSHYDRRVTGAYAGWQWRRWKKHEKCHMSPCYRVTLSHARRVIFSIAIRHAEREREVRSTHTTGVKTFPRDFYQTLCVFLIIIIVHVLSWWLAADNLTSEQACALCCHAFQ